MRAGDGRDFALGALLTVAGGVSALALMLAWARPAESTGGRQTMRPLRAGSSVVSWVTVRRAPPYATRSKREAAFAVDTPPTNGSKTERVGVEKAAYAPLERGRVVPASLEKSSAEGGEE